MASTIDTPAPTEALPALARSLAQPPCHVPQKRAFEDDHTPAVSSPLNPDSKAPSKMQVKMAAPDDSSMLPRERRTKKDSLKKRDSKATVPSAPSISRATPEKKVKDHGPAPAEIAPVRYVLPDPRASDFEPPRRPLFQSHHEVMDASGRMIEFCSMPEQAHNKKGFIYIPCIADPAFHSMLYYRGTETGPYGARLSFEDAASHMFFDRAGLHVTTDKGFRACRGNFAVRSGRWYWECKVTQGILKDRSEGDCESHGHVRVGWARREASLECPVGFDAYSYGLRDASGQKVHRSRPQNFFPDGESIYEGDVIGLEIQLPSEHLHKKVVQGHYNPAVDLADEEPEVESPNIVRDRLPIRYKDHIYLEKIDYSSSKDLEEYTNPAPVGPQGPTNISEPPNPHHKSPALRTLPNSHIKAYKNGEFMGTPFTDLLAFLPPASKPAAHSGVRHNLDLDDGTLGYYPAVSCFQGGAVEVNFGPNFWYPPPGCETPSEDVDMADFDAAARLENGAGASSRSKLRPACERYGEQIVEDVVYDIVDEVSFWVQDGGSMTGNAGSKPRVRTGVKVGGQAEIKELVQDD